MATIELFVIRTFLIWNITVRTDTVFEISEGIAKELIHRGVCITMEERKKRLAEKAKKKAEQEAAKPKAEKEPPLVEQKEELPLPKKPKKHAEAAQVSA